jgi:hypothetical protein
MPYLRRRSCSTSTVAAQRICVLSPPSRQLVIPSKCSRHVAHFLARQPLPMPDSRPFLMPSLHCQAAGLCDHVVTIRSRRFPVEPPPVAADGPTQTPARINRTHTHTHVALQAPSHTKHASPMKKGDSRGRHFPSSPPAPLPQAFCATMRSQKFHPMSLLPVRQGQYRARITACSLFRGSDSAEEVNHDHKAVRLSGQVGLLHPCTWISLKNSTQNFKAACPHK